MRSETATSSRGQWHAERLSRARALLGDAPAESGSRGSLPLRHPLGTGLHEWFSADQLPPIAILIGTAWRALRAQPHRRVFWIGRQCWPYPHALVLRGSGEPDSLLLDASVFVDARCTSERVWAIDVASRSEGAGLVVADGRGISMAESRRLQLAAEAACTSVQLIRPDAERAELSAARTRWRVAAQPDTDRGQAWSVELLRTKGGTEAWFASRGARRWVVKRDHATGTIGEWQACDGDLASEVVGGPLSASRTQIA